MDNLDRQILSALLDNCRESDRSIGSRLGISGGAVRARRQKMEDSGVIRQYAVRVEPPLLGFGVLYVVVTGEDTRRILEQCSLIGKPYLVVPCVGGITVCGVVVDSMEMQQKIDLARSLMKDVRILTIFEAQKPGRDPIRLTKTDLEVLQRLAASPRQRTDAIASDTGLSPKTVARCRDKMQSSPDVQFTLVYDPKTLDGYIPYVVLAWTKKDSPAEILPRLGQKFSQYYMQAPFLAKSQIVLFMYAKTIFEMDEVTKMVRSVDVIGAADLFIPKQISMYNQWLYDAIDEYKKSPKLHLT